MPVIRRLTIMKKFNLLITFLIVITVLGASFFAKANTPTINDTETNTVIVQTDERCKVADPTGTLLNVRSKPNGKKVIRKLKNGTTVFIVYESGDAQDRAWSKISLSNKRNAPVIGWVLREYLDCP